MSDFFDVFIFYAGDDVTFMTSSFSAVKTKLVGLFSFFFVVGFFDLSADCGKCHSSSNQMIFLKPTLIFTNSDDHVMIT